MLISPQSWKKGYFLTLHHVSWSVSVIQSIISMSVTDFQYFYYKTASNNEMVLIRLLSLYITSIFIYLCFYLQLYLSALSAYSASVSHTHRRIFIYIHTYCIYIYMCVAYINTHTIKMYEYILAWLLRPPRMCTHT